MNEPALTQPFFSSPPLSALAVTLRLFAVEQLERLLAGQPPVILAQRLSPEQIALLRPPRRLWPPSAWRRRPAGNVAAHVRALAAGDMPAPAFDALALRHVAARLGGAPAERLPLQLLPLVEQLAWTDLGFQLEVARALHRYQRTRVLFGPDDDPAPRLSEPALWLLVLAAPPVRYRWPAHIVPQRRAWNQATNRLRAYAHKRAAAAGWASFWDQWLMATIAAAWPEQLVPPDVGLRVGLAALPVVQTLGGATGASATAGTDATVPDLADPRWRDRAPAWYAAFERNNI
jgi:hypothetical protein